MGSRLPKKSKRAWEAGSDDEDAARKEKEEEEARERDQREKEEFAERLRLKDEEKTRKIMEAKVSKEQMEVCLFTATTQAAHCSCNCMEEYYKATTTLMLAG